MYNASAEPVFCLLKLLFSDVLVEVIVVAALLKVPNSGQGFFPGSWSEPKVRSITLEEKDVSNISQYGLDKLVQ